jgi:inositol-phosphate transport system ATP-binding protein
MSRGRIEQIGSADSLYQRPDSLFVAGFIGAPPINLLLGEATGGTVTVGEACLRLEGAASGPVVVGVRPEALRLGEGGLPAVVVEAEPMGRETLYLLDSPLGRVSALEAGGRARWRRAAPTTLRFDADASILFDRRSERRIVDARAILQA